MGEDRQGNVQQKEKEKKCKKVSRINVRKDYVKKCKERIPTHTREILAEASSRK